MACDFLKLCKDERNLLPEYKEKDLPAYYEFIQSVQVSVSISAWFRLNDFYYCERE